MWSRLLQLCSRMRFAWLRRRLDDEMKGELEGHLELLTERYVQAGMPPAEATVAARRQLGNVTVLREEIHRMNGMAWADSLGQDLRYAIRQARRSPGFSAVVVATLALGVGATTAVFTVVEAILLAPLPYGDPGQLVRVYMQEPGNPTTRRAGVSATHFGVLREGTTSLGAVAAIYTRSGESGLDLFKDGHSQRLRTLHITSNYFRTLRAGAVVGGGLFADDEAGSDDGPTGARRVVLSDRIWRSRFNGDPSVIGSSIQLSAEPYEVAGIAPPGLKDPVVGDVDAWLPYNLADDTFTQNYSLTLIGRMRVGIEIEQVQAELDVLSQSLASRWPDVRASSIIAVPLQSDLVDASRDLLQLLLIASGLVLLIACVNVANLLLVRGAGRIQEFAIRSALGSGHRRLVRQLLIESLVLAVAGGTLGLGLAHFGVRALERLGPQALPALDVGAFNPAVLGFGLLITLVGAMVSGVVPAMRLSRTDPSRGLVQHSRTVTSGRAQSRLRSGLAAAQLALALALLAGAGVLLTSFYRLQQVPLGFRVDRVLTFEISLPGIRYDAEARANFQEELVRRLEAIPGVHAAGGTSRLPATGTFNSWPIMVQSGPRAGTRLKPAEQPEHRTVSGNFFAVLGIPAVAGRTFDDRDDAAAPRRAVVSARFARLAFPGMPLEQVVGQRLVMPGRDTREIIGVVGDVTLDIYGTPDPGSVYSTHRQLAGNRNWVLSYVVSTDQAPSDLLGAVRAEVARLDPQLVVHRAAPMSDVVERGSRRERFALLLVATFAIAATTLGVLGLYGMLAYMVRQRTTEIGIRIALGATAAQVRAAVLRQAAFVLAIGIVIGIGGALLLGRWLSSLLFQTSAWDPRIIATTAALLAITGLIAAWLPARRASRIDPRIAIQEG
jgi:putative ABC transport system permease protein